MGMVDTFSFFRWKMTDGLRGLEVNTKKILKRETVDRNGKKRKMSHEWEMRGIRHRDPINLQSGVNHGKGC